MKEDTMFESEEGERRQFSVNSIESIQRQEEVFEKLSRTIS